MLKTTGKRVQKFHDNPDEFKNQFYKIKYPKKDDGLHPITGGEGEDKGSQDSDNSTREGLLKFPGEAD